MKNRDRREEVIHTADKLGDQPMEERNNIIVGALKECLSRESVEDTFDLYRIEDIQERIDKLNHCMRNPQTFFSSGDISLKDKYELTIQMFLTMSWKLNELYDKLGMGI
jgi:hypothetical protein